MANFVCVNISINFANSARFAVAEYLEEFDIEEMCYREIKSRYDNGEHISSKEFFSMVEYEEEQWRNSSTYKEAVEWLANSANWEHENYSDIYKDVYGIRPRW